jgi:hypothetical protein
MQIAKDLRRLKSAFAKTHQGGMGKNSSSSSAPNSAKVSSVYFYYISPKGYAAVKATGNAQVNHQVVLVCIASSRPRAKAVATMPTPVISSESSLFSAKSSLQRLQPQRLLLQTIFA